MVDLTFYKARLIIVSSTLQSDTLAINIFIFISTFYKAILINVYLTFQSKTLSINISMSTTVHLIDDLDVWARSLEEPLNPSRSCYRPG